MSWTAGETRRQAEWRDEYQRPKGPHRAQPVKAPQRGPSIPHRNEGGAMNLSPKAELIVTLEAAWKLLEGADPAPVRLAQIRGLIDHARAVVQRVGEVARARTEKSA
jgi:hypothetical protein